MLTEGMNNLQQAQFKKLTKGHKGIFKNTEIADYSTKLMCSIATVRSFLDGEMEDVVASTDKVKELQSELRSANEAIKGMQSELDSKNKFTAEQLWDVYAKGVGGKTYDDKQLPEYKDIGSQQKGWLAIVKLVNK